MEYNFSKLTNRFKINPYSKAKAIKKIIITIKETILKREITFLISLKGITKIKAKVSISIAIASELKNIKTKKRKSASLFTPYATLKAKIVEKVKSIDLKNIFKALAKIMSKVEAGDVPKIILSLLFLKKAL